MLSVTLRPLPITPFMGGEDEINEDDDETPLEDDEDGDGVDGVGEPRVMSAADIFLAVNESDIPLPLPPLLLLQPLLLPTIFGLLLLPILFPLPTVVVKAIKAVGLHVGLLGIVMEG